MNLKNAPDAVAEFHNRHAQAPGPTHKRNSTLKGG